MSLDPALARKMLNEVVAAATTSTASVSDLLRKSLVVATHLCNDPMRDWVHCELKGYGNAASLPDYRVLPAFMTVDLSGPFQSAVTNARLPTTAIQEKYRKPFEFMRIKGPIEMFEAMLAEGDDELTHEVNPNCYSLLEEGISDNYVIRLAKMHAGGGSVTKLVSAVRNRILDFALLIASQYPALIDTPTSNHGEKQKMEKETIHLINYGTQQVAIHSNVGFVGDITNISQDSQESLESYLTHAGVSTAAIQQIIEILMNTKEEKLTRFEKLKAWLASSASTLATGATTLAMSAAPDIIEAAAKKFLGLPQ